MRKLLLRYNLILVILMMMLLPAILALIVTLLGPRAIFKWMAHDYRLGGLTKEIDAVPFDFSHIKSHSTQKYLEDWVTYRLPMRSLFIRMNNQIYYSLFKKTFTDNGRMVIGKSNQLLEIEYIDSYCGRTVRTPQQLTEWADKLKIMSDFFHKQGKTFIYVTTPSKAEYMPLAIPDRFHCKSTGISQHVQQLEALLKERKVHYVNGSSLMQTATKEHKTPMFPRGGIHWNMLGASIGANAIINTINAEGHMRLYPLDFRYSLTKDVVGQDGDMMWLLNLLRPNYHYTVPAVTFESKHVTEKPLTAVCIGGSFLEKIIDIYMQNKTFSKMSYYRYFKLNKTDYEKDKKPVIQAVDTNSAHDFKAILSADVVILEENAALTISNHGQLFYNVMKQFFI